MLATFGVLLTQANFTPVSVFPFESWAVAENDCTWLGEMDAFRGVMLMVAGGPVELDEEPPQLARETLMASKHISTAARRVVLRASSISMILEANLAVAHVQKRGIQSVSAFNPACHVKLPGRLHGSFAVNCGALR